MKRGILLCLALIGCKAEVEEKKVEGKYAHSKIRVESCPTMDAERYEKFLKLYGKRYDWSENLVELAVRKDVDEVRMKLAKRGVVEDACEKLERQVSH